MSPRKPEVQQKQNVEEPQEQFSIKMALDTPGFLEFISKDSTTPADRQDVTKLKAIFEAFNAQALVTEKVQEVCKTFFTKKTGMTMTEDGLKLVAQHIEKQVRTNPDFVKRIDSLNDEIDSNTEKIEAYGARIHELGTVDELNSDIEQMNEKTALLEKSKWYHLFDKKEARKDLKKKFNLNVEKEGFDANKRLAELKSEFEELVVKRNTAADFSQYKVTLEAQVKRLRAGIFERALGESGVWKAMDQSVRQNLDKLINSGATFAELTEAQNLLNQMKETAKGGGDPYVYMRARFQDNIDMYIEQAAKVAIKEAMNKVKLTDAGVFTKTTDILKLFLKTPHMGSVEGEGVKEYVQQILHSIVWDLDAETPPPPDKNEKRNLIAFLIEDQDLWK